MKRKIALILCLSFILCGCGVSYDEAVTKEEDIGGYFTKIKEWSDFDNYCYYILYAKDTKVMYLMINGNHSSSIAPLYNADGSLQTYERK